MDYLAGIAGSVDMGRPMSGSSSWDCWIRVHASLDRIKTEGPSEGRVSDQCTLDIGAGISCHLS